MEKFMENIEVKYKIIEIDTQRHSMIVRYFTDEYDEDKLALEEDGEAAAVGNTTSSFDIYNTPNAFSKGKNQKKREQ